MIDFPIVFVSRQTKRLFSNETTPNSPRNDSHEGDKIDNMKETKPIRLSGKIKELSRKRKCLNSSSGFPVGLLVNSAKILDGLYFF